jgi:hypothetical protein
VENNTVEQARDPSDEPIIEYVRMVTSLIEGRRVSRDEILWRLKQISRQHNLWRGCGIDYVVQTLNKSPP